MAITLADIALDPWAPLAHKPIDGNGAVAPRAPLWLPPDDERRLGAYRYLQALVDNVARFYLPVDDEDREEKREYGDAALIADQTLSSLLGEEQPIVVANADSYQEDEPAETVVAPGGVTNGEAQAAADLQEWLREWADDEWLAGNMLEAERQAVVQGDGVYVLAWSAEKQRPTLTTYHPSVYFPERKSIRGADYPTTVHLAWEDHDVTDPKDATLRRVTFRLGPILPRTTMGVDERGRVRRIVDAVVGNGQRPSLAAGDSMNADGRISRVYPWSEEPSTVTCYMTDATWRLDDLEYGDSVYNLPSDKVWSYAENEDGEVLDQLDLRIDFIPVVHIPNTVAIQAHYGRSTLSRVAQLLDDISATDTDVQAAAGTTGLPIVGLSGAELPPAMVSNDDGTVPVRVRPGAVWRLGENGKLSTIDTATGLRALQDYVSAQRELLSVNSRLPSALLGRVKPSEVPSGVALALSFGPMTSMIREMRLARAVKYRLLLKFVQRLAMGGRTLPAGDTLDAEVQFGNYLPSDEQTVVDQVTALLGAKAISVETAVALLVDAGFPIDDVSEEVQRIQGRSFAEAAQLLEATGDEQAVFDYLGLEQPPTRPVQPAAQTAAAFAPGNTMTADQQQAMMDAAGTPVVPVTGG